VTRDGFAAHVRRRVWKPLVQRAAAAAEDCEVLWQRTAVYLLLGNNCESGRAGFAADRGRCGGVERERRASGRKDVCILQPAGGEQGTGDSAKLYQRVGARGAGIFET